MILFMFVAGSLGSSHAHIDTTTYKTLTDSVFVVGDRILVRDIRFTLSGGSRVLDYSKPVLKVVGTFLKSNPNLIVEIAWFTDHRGAQASNKKLSEMRAQRIFDYLVQELGVQASQLIPVGYGSSEPIIPAEQISQETEKYAIEKLHQINRRMELRVVGF